MGCPPGNPRFNHGSKDRYERAKKAQLEEGLPLPSDNFLDLGVDHADRVGY